jgi:tripartite-type tricarboxylate transporter receptor subunit TctC
MRAWSLTSFLCTGFISLSIFCSGFASAQTYPSKPIRIVAPFPPGGSVDILARIIGAELQKSWGQNVLIDNRPGAGGNIGSDNIAKSAPDGYSLLIGSNGTHAINPALYAKMPYDAIRDFSPITLVASSPNIFTTHPSLPAKNVKEFIALAKANPGKVTYGSGGIGTSQHLSVELFRSQANISLIHVPYKGAGPLVTALLSGEIAMSCQSLPSMGTPSHVNAGRLHGLAVTSGKRSSVLPQVPTLMESGFPKFDVSAWWGMMAPAGTPEEIVNKLNKEVIRILNLPSVRKQLMEQGLDILTSTPAEYHSYIKNELALWAPVVKSSGARVD